MVSPVCLTRVASSSCVGVWVLVHVDSNRLVCSGVMALEMPGILPGGPEDMSVYKV